MGYPKEEVVTDWGKVLFIEMTPEEYEKELKNFKNLSEKFLGSSNYREIEYGEYLKNWFSEVIVDGAPFSLKYKWHRLPMTFIQYIWG